MSRPLRLIPRCLLALLVVVAACGEGDSVGEDELLRPGGRTARPHTAVEADLQAWDQPSLATRANGDVALACIAWNGEADTLELSTIAGTQTGPRTLYRSPTRMLGTTCAEDGGANLRVIWSEQDADGWSLRELIVGADAGVRTIVPSAGSHHLDPALAADADGNLLLVWVALDGDRMAIMGSALSPEGVWTLPQEVSAGRRSNWWPAVAASAPGEFAVVWDSPLDGDYDVLLARVHSDEHGHISVRSRSVVAGTPRFEAHPSVAADGSRLYVSYDVGPERWGREGSINKLEQALHDMRSIEIVVVEGDTVAPLAVSPLDEMNEVLARKCELPQIVVESTGNLVLFFRGLPLPPEFDDPQDPAFQELAEEKGGGKGWRSSIWFTYMTRFDGREWTLLDRHHVGIPGSEGRADAPVAVTRLAGGGTAYAVVGDGREKKALPEEAAFNRRLYADQLNWWRPVSEESTAVTAGRLQKGPQAGAIETGVGVTMPEPAQETAPETGAGATRSTRTLADGRTLTLAFGDLHRHTDLSRCSSNWDGPVSDALRYAFDVAPLEFLAITDHFEHMTKYDWWRTLGLADAYDAPGRMASLRAYERADGASGHRNVIARGDELPVIAYRHVFNRDRDDGKADSPAALWKHLPEGHVITIPHTPAGMYPDNPVVMDWSGFNPAYDRVVEVFQGYRGSSEALGAPRAIEGMPAAGYVRPNLDLGMHFGLIAASDHQSSDGAFAGAWVTGVTRGEVFEGLHARRTFASTVRAALWTEWGGVAMGVSAPAPADGAREFTVEVDGYGRELAKIEILGIGGVLAEREVSGTSAAESFALELPAEGSAYAYARVTFADGELIWGSPTRLSIGAGDGPDGLSGPAALERHGDVWPKSRPGDANGGH